MGEELYKVEEYVDKEVMEESVAYMKMVLVCQISPVNLKIKSGLNSQIIPGKG